MDTGCELFVVGKVVYPHIPIRILEGGGDTLTSQDTVQQLRGTGGAVH